MASFMDSKSVFVQRLITCDVPQEAVDKLVAVGVNSLSKLAFCTNYQPSMPDESPLVNFFKATISPDADIPAGVMSSLRRAFYEAHTFMLNDLRGKIDKKDDETPRRVPQAERNSRLQDQRARLSGIDIAGVLEPSDSLVDTISQQREDELLRYIELEQCTCRESEVRTAKTTKSNKADLSSDFLIRQALQRRALAYDQLNIFPYSYLEAWHTFLFNLANREPLKIEGAVFNRISMTQLLEADRQAYVLASDRCRTGLQQKPDGSYPAVEAFDHARRDPLVVSLLQPIQASRNGDRREQRQGKPEGENKGKGKQRKLVHTGGKGKGKKHGPSCPKELIGLHLRTKDGNPICYSFNLGGCSAAAAGERCPKGFHSCAKCLGHHGRADCPKL
jgi:hypothetical protein